jgi:hypothetical protein
MTAEPPSPDRQRLREEVLVELSKFLRARNTEKKSFLSNLNRPIVITLIGTVFITLLTTYWSTLQHRLDFKYELLNTVPSAHQKSGNILNHWLEHVLWIAEERSKPRAKQDVKALDEWSKRVAALQQEYAKTDSLDGILTKVEAIYVREEVRSRARRMKTTLTGLEDLLQTTNRAYNPTQSLKSEQIRVIRAQRIKLVSELNTLKDELLAEMAKESSSFSWTIFR